MVCTSPHTFYLLLKVLQHLADAPENAKVDSSTARTQLAEILTIPHGIQFCQKDLQIDLLRREIMLQDASKYNSVLLVAMMTKKLAEGDANWATIITAIHAAYANATSSSTIPTINTDLSAAAKESVPGNWWTSSEADYGDFKGIRMLVSLKDQLEKSSFDEGFSKKDRGLTLGLLKLATWYPDYPAPQLPGTKIHKLAPVSRLTSRPVDLIVLYLQRHANKACCFSDLREYLALLPEDGRQTVLSWIESHYTTAEIDVEVGQSLYTLSAWAEL